MCEPLLRSPPSPPRVERADWLSQLEQREQQTMAALSHRDQQLSHMGALLEEARLSSKPRPTPQEGYQTQVRTDLVCIRVVGHLSYGAQRVTF